MIDPLSAYVHKASGRHGPIILMYHSVVSGVGTPNWPWAVSLKNFISHLDFLKSEGWKTVTMGELAAQPHNWDNRTIVLTFDDGYADNFAAFKEIKQRGMCATWFIATASIGTAPNWQDNDRGTTRLLNVEELLSMQSNGMEIGSHTHNHVRLTGLKKNQVTLELTDSQKELEDKLENKVLSFAYPYGDWNEDCELAVKNTGYKYACTTRPGWALRDNNPFRLRRISVFNSDNVSILARKLAFAANDVKWLHLAGYYVNRIKIRFLDKM